MSSVPRIHRGLAFGFLGLGVLQFFFAGLGVFGDGIGSSDYDLHRIMGSLLTLVALILVILAALGRREALVASAVLLVLMILQTVLAQAVGTDAPAIAALHPLNGLVVLFVAHQAARGLPLPGIGGGTHRTAA
jgi:hypothetical protein